MIRAVIDTNVLVSGLGWPGGPPAEIVAQALRGSFVPVTSEPLLSELGRTLCYPKLAEAFRDPSSVVRLVAGMSEVVQPITRLQVLTDEPDNRVLEAAVGSADFIITGDKALLHLSRYEHVAILIPADFLEVLRIRP